MKKKFEITFMDYADSFQAAVETTDNVSIDTKISVTVSGKKAVKFIIEYEQAEDLISLGYNHAKLLMQKGVQPL